MKTIRFIISVAILLLLTVNQGFTQNKVTFRAIVSEGYKKRIYVENIKDDTQKYPTIVLKKENNYSADFELKNKTTCLVSVNINGFERAERLEITDEIKEVTIEVKEGAWKNEVSTSIFRIHKFSLVEWRRRILVDVDYSSVDSCQFVFDSTKTFKESFRNYQQQFYNLYQRMKYVTVLHSYSDRTQENPYDYSVCYLGFKRNPIKQNWLKEALGMKGKNYPYVRYLSFVRSMPLNQALQALDKQTQTHFDYLRQMKDSISQNLYKHLMTDVIFDNYNQKLKAIAYYRDHCDTIKLFNRLKSCSYYFLEQAFSDTCINKKFCIQSNINPYWADLDALLKEKEDFFTGYKIIMSQTNTNPEMEKAQHIYDYVLDTVAFNKPCYSVDSYEYRNFFNTWLNYKKGQFRKQDTTISELKDKYLTVKKYLQGVNTAYFLGEMLVMLKAKDNKEVIELSKDYLKNYKDNYYTSLFSKQLCGIQEVRIGKTAPNFKAKNLTDENVQLKDLRGKWVCLLQDYGRDTTGQGKLNLVFVVITPSKPNNIFSNIQWYISDKENNDYNKYYQNLPYAAILINPKGEVVHFFDYDFLFRNPYNGSLDYVGVNSVNVRTIEALIKKVATKPVIQEEKTEIQSPIQKERIYIKPTVKSYLQVILITVFLALILVGILAYRIRKIIRKREAQKRKALELELWALRSQINPHFLFNTFNSLINIIEEQTSDEAIDFVQELSKTYRYLLTTNSSDLSTIENELDFLRSYLFLLENRYGENLKTEIEISESYYQNKVPSLSLHLLVENAIKHNVISDKKPLTVHISIDNNDFLNISNAIQRKTTFVPSTKIGLENIRRRYEFYTEQTTEIIDDGENFTVKIPLLKSD